MIVVNLLNMEKAELTKEQCADLLAIPHEFCLKALLNHEWTEEKPFVFFMGQAEADAFFELMKGAA